MGLALITGARGFIGRHLSRHVARNSGEVVGLGHGAWIRDDFARWGLSYWFNGDVNPSNLDRIAADVGIPDQIFHLAGGSSVGFSLDAPGEDFRRSVDSTFLLLDWVRTNASDAHLVLASSAAVYGDGQSRPICETDAVKPFSPYGYHKRIAELLCESFARNFRLSIAIVRLFSVYGPELRKQLLWDLCTRFRDKPEVVMLSGSGEEKRDWIHVEDAVGALTKSVGLANQDNVTVNGGTGEGVSIRDVAYHARAVWGLGTEICFNGRIRPGDPRSLVADVTMARRVGFFVKKDWRMGIREYVEWFRQIEMKERL